MKLGRSGASCTLKYLDRYSRFGEVVGTAWLTFCPCKVCPPAAATAPASFINSRLVVSTFAPFSFVESTKFMSEHDAIFPSRWPGAAAAALMGAVPGCSGRNRAVRLSRFIDRDLLIAGNIENDLLDSAGPANLDAVGRFLCAQTEVQPGDRSTRDIRSTL